MLFRQQSRNTMFGTRQVSFILLRIPMSVTSDLKKLISACVISTPVYATFRLIILMPCFAEKKVLW